MSERYTRLFALPAALYSEGSPILIAAGALLKDNNTGKVLAQLKLQNIGKKVIKAVTVKIISQDTAGRILGEPAEHQYLDLSLMRDEQFGQKEPVILPDNTTRSFKVNVTEVVFDDNSIWKGSDTAWEPLPQPRPLSINDSELFKQYCLEYGADSMYTAEDINDLWYCACGALNRRTEVTCHKCGKSFSVLSSVDMKALEEKRDERLKQEKQAQEEVAQKAEQIKAENIKKAVKIAIPIAAVCLTVVLLVTQVFIPLEKAKKEKELKYEKAVALYEKRDYISAYTLFEELGDYKDSTEYIKESKDDLYANAMQKLEDGEFKEANRLLTTLGDYKDSKDITIEYQEYKSLVESGDDIDGLIAFLENSKYLKDDDKLQTAKYCEPYCGLWRSDERLFSLHYKEDINGTIVLTDGIAKFLYSKENKCFTGKEYNKTYKLWFNQQGNLMVGGYDYSFDYDYTVYEKVE